MPAETIDTNEAIKIFQQMLQPDSSIRILRLYGDGKMGNSDLLMKVFPTLLQQDYRMPFAFVDMSRPLQSIPDILSQICLQLDIEKFERFYKADNWWSNRSKVEVKELTATFSKVVIFAKGNAESIHDKVRSLTREFTLDISKLNLSLVVLLIDSFDQASVDNRDWLMETLLVALSRLSHIRIVVAGRVHPEAHVNYRTLCRDFLLQTNNSAEKAAIIAEYFFGQFSAAAAEVARQCALFHWFDKSVIEALLRETEITSDEKELIYRQFAALPFVERLLWGQRYQALTREGLLSKYSLYHPELLHQAARLAAPEYTSRKESKMSGAEGFFCYMVAGNPSASMNLLEELIEKTNLREDWPYADELIRMQDEAESFPFVLPLPRSEQQWILRGTVHSVQGRLEDARADYDQAISINDKSIPAYIGRGKVFVKQQKYKRALKDFNYALKFEPNNIHIYANRSVIYAKQEHYDDALRDLDRSLEIEPNNPYILYNKSAILSDIEQFEQALTVYEDLVQMYPNMIEAHVGKGEALFKLQRYTESLAAYEEAIRLGPYLSDAPRGKGNALLALNRYGEAQLAYEEARQLELFTVGMENEVIQRIPATQASIKYDGIADDVQSQRYVSRNEASISSPERLRSSPRLRKEPKRRKTYRFGYFVERVASLGAIAFIIIASVLLFATIKLSPNPHPNVAPSINVTPNSSIVPNLTSISINVENLLIQSSDGIQCPQGNQLVLATNRVAYDLSEIAQMRSYVDGQGARLPPTLNRVLGGSMDTIPGESSSISTCIAKLNLTNIGNTALQIPKVGVQLEARPQPNAFQYRLIDLCSVQSPPPQRCSLASISSFNSFSGSSCDYSASIQLEVGEKGTIYSATPTGEANNCGTLTLDPSASVNLTLDFTLAANIPKNLVYSILPVFTVTTALGEQTFSLLQVQRTLAFAGTNQFSCYTLQLSTFVLLKSPSLPANHCI